MLPSYRAATGRTCQPARRSRPRCAGSSMPANRCRASATCKLRSPGIDRSEEHTSELQSLMRTSYAVFCLQKKRTKHTNQEIYKTPNTKNVQSNQQNEKQKNHQDTCVQHTSTE